MDEYEGYLLSNRTGNLPPKYQGGEFPQDYIRATLAPSENPSNFTDGDKRHNSNRKRAKYL